MTQTGFSTAFVSTMLSWIKALATWVLKLFNLTNSSGNPLLWLSENWLKLLIILVVAGLAIDWIVWMIRWRPYWVWTKKKRVVVNDEKLLRDDDELERGRNGEVLQQRYVVPSTVVVRSESRRRQAEQQKKKAPAKRRKRPAQTAQKRPATTANVQRPTRRRGDRVEPVDDLFEVGRDADDVSVFYEDEVFNVSNLPENRDTHRNRKRHR